MGYPPAGVAAFHAKIKSPAILSSLESNPQINQLIDPFRPFLDNHSHDTFITEPVTRGDGIGRTDASRQIADTCCKGRIVSVLEGIVAEPSRPRPSFVERFQGWCQSSLRGLKKRYNASLPGSINQPAFQKHRYPGVSLEEVRERVRRFQRALGKDARLRVEEVGGRFYRIST